MDSALLEHQHLNSEHVILQKEKEKKKGLQLKNVLSRFSFPLELLLDEANLIQKSAVTEILLIGRRKSL